MNKVLISALKPQRFFRCYDYYDYYFVHESYNEEQGIEIIILWTSSFFTEPISFPVLSAVRRYITLLQ